MANTTMDKTECAVCRKEITEPYFIIEYRKVYGHGKVFRSKDVTVCKNCYKLSFPPIVQLHEYKMIDEIYK